jgi:hypothetical protein
VLTRIADKLLGRDLAGRRTAAIEEGKTLITRADALKERRTDLERRLADLTDRRLPDVERQKQLLRAITLLPAGTAAGEAWMSRLDAAVASLDSEIEEIDRLQGTVGADADAVKREADELEIDQKKLVDTFESIKAEERGRLRRFVQITLVFQLVVLCLSLFAPSTGYAHRSAAEVHLTYYSAIAAIMPVLLVAGLVELVLIRLQGGGWTVVSFAVPSFSATSAALYVLATHQTTPATFGLTLSGLTVTGVLLLSYFVIHTETPSAS